MEKTRYYSMAIQYNMTAQAENRTAPKGFNTLDEAIAEFHTGMGSDMKNASLGWSLRMVFDSNGAIIKNEKWVRETVEE